MRPALRAGLVPAPRRFDPLLPDRSPNRHKRDPNRATGQAAKEMLTGCDGFRDGTGETYLPTYLVKV